MARQKALSPREIRAALVNLVYEFLGSLNQAEIAKLYRCWDAVKADLVRHVIPDPPERIRIKILPTDTLESLPRSQTNISGQKKLSDEDCVMNQCGIVTIERVVFHRDHEVFVHREEMLQRERGLGRQIGVNGAAALLREQDKLPVHWRGRRRLLLSGVVRRRPRSRELEIGYLSWGKGCWRLKWAPSHILRRNTRMLRVCGRTNI